MPLFFQKKKIDVSNSCMSDMNNREKKIKQFFFIYLFIKKGNLRERERADMKGEEGSTKSAMQ